METHQSKDPGEKIEGELPGIPNSDLWQESLSVLQELGIPAFITRYETISHGTGVVADMNAMFTEVMASFGKSGDPDYYRGKDYVTLHGGELAKVFYDGDWQALRNPKKPQRIDEGPKADVVKVSIGEPGSGPAFMLGFFVIYGEEQNRDPDQLDPRLQEAIERLAIS